MFWIALAAQISAATLVGGRVPDVRAVFSADDMPARVQREGVSRTVYTRTVVRPDGTTQGCGIEESSGDTGLDGYTCALIVRRAKFAAAKWSDGSAVYGVIRVPVTWAIGSPPSPKSVDGDLNLTVRRLPKGVKAPHFERLIFGVDEEGRILSCEGQWLPGMDKTDPDLASTACDQLKRSYKPIPTKDDVGHTTRSIQNGIVRYEE
jgi:TonB family protein